jgi:hypothetical protein
MMELMMEHKTTSLHGSFVGAIRIIQIVRGDCGVVWFSFKSKSHSNREIKMHVVRFASVGFKKVIQTNRCGYDWFGGCGLQHNISVPNNFKHLKKT